MSTITPYVTNNTTAAIHYIRGTGGSKMGDRAVYEWAQHTRPDSAIEDFVRLRKTYGQQGAKRRPMGKYFKPDYPSEATHIRIGKNWREAKPGETATHIRVVSSEALVKRSEGIHYVHSFGLHEVNPKDQTQTHAAFESVKALYQEKYPGLQLVMAAHLDSHGSKKAQECGEGGKFHVHVVVNAVIYEEMSVGDRVYPRGNRVSGELNRIFEVWERNDNFLEERGHEFGLPKQVLPSQKSKEGRAVRAGHSVHRAYERGEIAPKELIVNEVEATLEKLTMGRYPREIASLVDSDRIEFFVDMLESRGKVRASARYVKSRDEIVLRSFWVEGSKQRFGKHALGDRYSNQGIQEQLEEIAQGRWKPIPEPEQLYPREAEQLTHEELDALVEEINNTPMVLEYEREQEAKRAATQTAPKSALEKLTGRKSLISPEQEAEFKADTDALARRLFGGYEEQRVREDSKRELIEKIEAEQAELRDVTEPRVKETKPVTQPTTPSFLSPVSSIKPQPEQGDTEAEASMSGRDEPRKNHKVNNEFSNSSTVESPREQTKSSIEDDEARARIAADKRKKMLEERFRRSPELRGVTIAKDPLSQSAARLGQLIGDSQQEGLGNEDSGYSE